MPKIKVKVEKAKKHVEDFIENHFEEIVFALGFLGMSAVCVGGTVVQNKMLAKEIVKEMGKNA